MPFNQLLELFWHIERVDGVFPLGLVIKAGVPVVDAVDHDGVGVLPLEFEPVLDPYCPGVGPVSFLQCEITLEVGDGLDHRLRNRFLSDVERLG